MLFLIPCIAVQGDRILLYCNCNVFLIFNYRRTEYIFPQDKDKINAFLANFTNPNLAMGFVQCPVPKYSGRSSVCSSLCVPMQSNFQSSLCFSIVSSMLLFSSNTSLPPCQTQVPINISPLAFLQVLALVSLTYLASISHSWQYQTVKHFHLIHTILYNLFSNRLHQILNASYILSSTTPCLLSFLCVCPISSEFKLYVFVRQPLATLYPLTYNFYIIIVNMREPNIPAVATFASTKNQIRRRGTSGQVELVYL